MGMTLRGLFFILWRMEGWILWPIATDHLRAPLYPGGFGTATSNCNENCNGGKPWETLHSRHKKKLNNYHNVINLIHIVNDTNKIIDGYSSWMLITNCPFLNSANHKFQAPSGCQLPQDIAKLLPVLEMAWAALRADGPLRLGCLLLPETGSKWNNLHFTEVHCHVMFITIMIYIYIYVYVYCVCAIS